MQFISRYKRARYTPRPTRWVHWGPGQKEKVEGIHVQFENYTFDTESGQRNDGWTDDERKEVEAYLMAHRDFGALLHHLDPARANAPTDDETAVPVAQCLFMVIGADGPQVCGERVDEEGGYCSKHSNMVEDTPVRRPNRSKTTTNA